jgi:hypothetical protein
VTNNTNHRIDISKKLVLQMLDEDDTVSEDDGGVVVVRYLDICII